MKSILTTTLAALALASLAPAAVLRTEHADLGVAFADGAFDLHVHDETNDAEYEPGAALLLVRYAAHEAIPPGSEYDFLRPGGETHLWRLPRVANPNLLFLGIGSEEIAPGTLDHDEYTLALTSVSGPAGGHFTIYDVDGFGVPEVICNSGDGLTGADSRIFAAGTHGDFNFTFSRPGDYEITFTVTALVGGVTKTGTATYRFHVQSEAESQGAAVVAQVADGVVLAGGAPVSFSKLGSADLGETTGDAAFSAVLKGDGITSANDAALILQSGGVNAIAAQEGSAAFGLAGSQLGQLGDPALSNTGTIAFTGTLRQGFGGATSANDAFLATSDAAGVPVLIAREGSPAPGLAGFSFTKINWFFITGSGAVYFHAKVGDGTLSRLGVWKYDGSLALVAAQNTPLVTELGTRLVSKIGKPTATGTARDQARVGNAAGELTLLITFTDGTRQILRFPAAN
jgi:surface-anchored protein